MLNNHAAIVSMLDKGNVKIQLHNQLDFSFENLDPQITRDANDDKVLLLPIEGGLIEMKNNKIIILADWCFYCCCSLFI